MINKLEINKSRFIELYYKDLSIKQIALDLHVSITSIRNWIKKLQLTHTIFKYNIIWSKDINFPTCEFLNNKGVKTGGTNNKFCKDNDTYCYRVTNYIN